MVPRTKSAQRSERSAHPVRLKRAAHTLKFSNAGNLSDSAHPVVGQECPTHTADAHLHSSIHSCHPERSSCFAPSKQLQFPWENGSSRRLKFIKSYQV